jgi:hypothetical protein
MVLSPSRNCAKLSIRTLAAADPARGADLRHSSAFSGR